MQAINNDLAAAGKLIKCLVQLSDAHAAESNRSRVETRVAVRQNINHRRANKYLYIGAREAQKAATATRRMISHRLTRSLAGRGGRKRCCGIYHHHADYARIEVYEQQPYSLARTSFKADITLSKSNVGNHFSLKYHR
jgi:hypothetical protein